MDFSIMFWGDATACKDDTARYYSDLLRIAQFAEDHGFCAVWLPERHFHPWGGLHPNPSVIAAALAVATRRIRLRAGSVVLPLHSPIRVAEEWAVVDNLSRGRVEVSIATGWKDDDFVIAPSQYERRLTEVWQSIETVRSLWRGGRYVGPNGRGVSIDVATLPRPVQDEIPIWMSCAGSPETMLQAGARGYGVVTHLLKQDFGELSQKLVAYRESLRTAGRGTPDRIALMIHTFLGHNRETVREIVREPLAAFLMNSADLGIPRDKRDAWERADSHTKAEMVRLAADRYCERASLIGTVESCRATVDRIQQMGVTEVCCLIDFGLPADVMLESMRHVAHLADMYRGKSVRR